MCHYNYTDAKRSAEFVTALQYIQNLSPINPLCLLKWHPHSENILFWLQNRYWNIKGMGKGLENRDYGRGDPLRWPHSTLYPQKLALTSPTSGGRQVGIVRLRTTATEFSFFLWERVKTVRRLSLHFPLEPSTPHFPYFVHLNSYPLYCNFQPFRIQNTMFIFSFCHKSLLHNHSI
jgi:hypothetical protein